VAAVLQALLFSLVLPRVKGVTFALVTLGFAECFTSSSSRGQASKYTGADVGLQGVIPARLSQPGQRAAAALFHRLGILVLV